MKKFDFEKAKAGAKVCTRDGFPVRILCFDSKVYDDYFPIFALVMLSDKREELIKCSRDGKVGYKDNNDDLMMVD